MKSREARPKAGSTLSPCELAQLLGVTTRSVQRYCQEGLVPARRVGGGRVRSTWQIDRAGLAEVLRGWGGAWAERAALLE